MLASYVGLDQKQQQQQYINPEETRPLLPHKKTPSTTASFLHPQPLEIYF
jgi:hypothetical protein